MKSLIMIGTGAHAAELTQFYEDNAKQLPQIDYQIKGYLDLNSQNYEKYCFKAPFLGDESTYQIEENDYFLLAFADIPRRQKVVRSFKEKKFKFASLVHHSALISETAQIGEGCVIHPFTIIGPNAKIGDFNLINSYAQIGHDSCLGHFNVICPHVTIGVVEIGNENYLGTGSSVLPNAIIGSNCKVQGGVLLDKKLPDNNYAFNPTRIKNMAIFFPSST